MKGRRCQDSPSPRAFYPTLLDVARTKGTLKPGF